MPYYASSLVDARMHLLLLSIDAARRGAAPMMSSLLMLGPLPDCAFSHHPVNPGREEPTAADSARLKGHVPW
jgi:hypothetical protein